MILFPFPLLTVFYVKQRIDALDYVFLVFALSCLFMTAMTIVS